MERRHDRLLAAARERCRSLRIEPPSPTAWIGWCALPCIGRRMILRWFRGHPEARFELEVFDG